MDKSTTFFQNPSIFGLFDVSGPVGTVKEPTLCQDFFINKIGVVSINLAIKSALITPILFPL